MVPSVAHYSTTFGAQMVQPLAQRYQWFFKYYQNVTLQKHREEQHRQGGKKPQTRYITDVTASNHRYYQFSFSKQKYIRDYYINL